MGLIITKIKKKGNKPSDITHFQTEYGTVFSKELMSKKLCCGGNYDVNSDYYEELKLKVDKTGEIIVCAHDNTPQDPLMSLPTFD